MDSSVTPERPGEVPEYLVWGLALATGAASTVRAWAHPSLWIRKAPGVGAGSMYGAAIIGLAIAAIVGIAVVAIVEKRRTGRLPSEVDQIQDQLAVMGGALALWFVIEEAAILSQASTIVAGVVAATLPGVLLAAWVVAVRVSVISSGDFQKRDTTIAKWFVGLAWAVLWVLLFGFWMRETLTLFWILPYVLAPLVARAISPAVERLAGRYLTAGVLLEALGALATGETKDYPSDGG